MGNYEWGMVETGGFLPPCCECNRGVVLSKIKPGGLHFCEQQKCNGNRSDSSLSLVCVQNLLRFLCFWFDLCTELVAVFVLFVWFVYRTYCVKCVLCLISVQTVEIFFAKKISNPPAFGHPPICIRKQGGRNPPAFGHPPIFLSKNRGSRNPLVAKR
jgi:hypothetical protein